MTHIQNNIHERTSWHIHRSTIEQLRRLKFRMGVSSYEDVIRVLLAKYEADSNEISNNSIATCDRVFNHLGTKPVVVSGQPGSGKTTTVKELLKQWKCSVFCVDIHDEYKELELTDLGRFYSLDFAESRARFVPNRNVLVGNSECAAIFQHLLMMMHSGSMNECVLVVEEAHRFANDNSLRSLIAESRKFIRKLIIVCSDSKLYQDIAIILFPTCFEVIG